MKLIFDIIKNGRELPIKRNFHFDMTNGIIGRSEEADWQLADRQNYISSKHVHIEYKDMLYFIKDVSTNGTYLKYPYKKLPKEVSIKINSTDIFIIGDYEIQARFMDNDYSSKDVITSKPTKELEPVGNSEKSNSSLNLIPDDDFLLEDTNIMNNSFTTPEEEVFDSNVMNIFQEEEKKNNFDDDLYDFEKSETIVESESFSQDTISNETLQEHIIIPKFKADEVLTPPENTKKIQKKELSIVQEVIEEKDEEIEKTFENEKSHLHEIQVDNSIQVLEKKLGINLSSLSKEEKENTLTEIADIVLNSLDGLKSSLDIKEKIKSDLLISDANPEQADANPVRMGQYSLNLIDNKNNKNGIKISEAVKKSFSELDIHNIALHRSSKNLINIAVLKFSPKSLEHNFETNGELSALMPKKYQMWDAYVNMFKKLNEDPDFGINLIDKDFSNEYNKIAYTIKLTSI